MNDQPGPRPERRRSVRISPKGTVVMHGGADLQQRGRLANVGDGGLYIETAVKAPERLLGRQVDLDIRLDTGRAEWVRVNGRVIRIHADGLAICFDTPPTALLRIIDEMTTASRARARVIAVVLIDADTERRSAMASGFRATGCAVVEASTPLEAVVRLGESSFEPDVVAVADSFPAKSADEMRAFVERDHPNAKLVTIGDDLLEPDGIANWLSSADPGSDLPHRIRDVLVRTRRQLRPS